MKRQILSLFTALAVVVGLAPAALAAEREEKRWLLPEDFTVEEMTEEELDSGGIAPEEGSLDFPRDPEGITGDRNVLVAPVRFAGEEEFLNAIPEEYGGRTVEELIGLAYTGADVSVQAYYDQLSFGALNISPVWLLDEGGSLQLTHERGYYMPLSLDNEEGYLMHLRAVRVFTRSGRETDKVVYVPELSCDRSSSGGEEHVLLDGETGELWAICDHMDARVEQRSDGRLELVWSGALTEDHSWEDSSCFYSEEYEDRGREFQSEVYLAINSLAHEQGVEDIDCTTVWISGDVTGWASLLWPHQEEFSAWGPTYYREGADKVYIALLTDNSLATQVQGHLPDGTKALLPEVGTLTHELGHVLGFPDYYSYYDQTMLNMGTWSVMELQSDIPQNLHGWASYIYGGWLGEENVQQISAEGTYTITTISGATQEERDGGAVYLYYIENPAGDPDYPERIVLEYRSPRGVFEQAQRDVGWMVFPGLILYSVDDEAERRLGGNISATGKDGRYGAKLYYTSGIAAGILGNYEELDALYQQLYDMMLSPLADLRLSLRDGGEFLTRDSYGSADPEETAGTLTSRRTGENSGIVICDAAIDPEDMTKLSFWVDLDAPEAVRVEDDRQIGLRTVSITFDEPVVTGPGWEGIDLSQGVLAASVEEDTLTVALTGAGEGAELTIPADAVVDQAGRSLEEEIRLTLDLADRHAVFSDVPETHWAWPAVTATADALLFQGVGEDRFVPDATLTRGMFVTVLGRMASAEVRAGESGFYDVAPDTWYTPYVNWAADNGIVTGVGEGNFAPDRPITREQMAVILHRYLAWLGWEFPDGDAALYADDSYISPWAREAVYALRAAGLMGGKEGNRFDPAAPATRAQAAQVIWRCMELS